MIKMEKQIALGVKEINIQNVAKKLKLTPIEFKVRNMRKKDISQVLEIYKDTEWQTGNHSIQTWYELDPCAFKVAVTDTGKVLAVCGAVRHHPNLYFIGYYIARKKYRGQGIGIKVWNACMDYIGQRNAGLNAVPEKLELYRTKSGFQFCEEQHTVLEYETNAFIHPENLVDSLPKGVTIVPFRASHLPSMFNYDYEVCGYNRSLAIELNCKEKETKTLVALEDGACVGFGTIKRSVQDIPQVGPLYAEDPAIAETILKRLLLSYPLKKGFYMATFQSNEAATKLMSKIDCPLTYTLPRLYKSEMSMQISTEKVFAHFDVNCSPV